MKNHYQSFKELIGVPLAFFRKTTLSDFRQKMIRFSPDKSKLVLLYLGVPICWALVYMLKNRSFL